MKMTRRSLWLIAGLFGFRRPVESSAPSLAPLRKLMAYQSFARRASAAMLDAGPENYRRLQWVLGPVMAARLNIPHGDLPFIGAWLFGIPAAICELHHPSHNSPDEVFLCRGIGMKIVAVVRWEE